MSTIRTYVRLGEGVERAKQSHRLWHFLPEEVPEEVASALLGFWSR